MVKSLIDAGPLIALIDPNDPAHLRCMGCLPQLSLPLITTWPALVLDIQGLVNIAYVEGRYDDIDYTQPPVPPLSPDDAAWAEQMVRAGRKGMN